MAIWLKKIELKEPINKYVYYDYPFDKFKEDVIKILEENNLGVFAKRLKRIKTEKGFDNILEELYNFADENRIWLGI